MVLHKIGSGAHGHQIPIILPFIREKAVVIEKT